MKTSLQLRHCPKCFSGVSLAVSGDNRHSFGLQLSRCSSLYVILDKDDIRHTTFESAFFAILRFKTYDSASERSAESKPRGIS